MIKVIGTFYIKFIKKVVMIRLLILKTNKGMFKKETSY